MFYEGLEVTPGKRFDHGPRQMSREANSGVELTVVPGVGYGEVHMYWHLGEGTGIQVDRTTGDCLAQIERMTFVAGLDGVGVEAGKIIPIERQLRLQKRGILPVHAVFGFAETKAALREYRKKALTAESVIKLERHYKDRPLKIRLENWQPEVVLRDLSEQITYHERVGAASEAKRLTEIHARATQFLIDLTKSIETARGKK